MAKFELGYKVKNINTGEVGYIIKIHPPHRGIQSYRVKYDYRESDENSQYLMPDVDLTDAFERLRQNIYGQFTEYIKDNTIYKIQCSNNSTISSLKASKTLFRVYQFKPLMKFLNSDNRRILIADEVGLGKTIEAGHIMLELKARGEFHNALVVCPMALREKWVTELNDKFGLDFIKIDDKEQLIQELRYHNGYVRAVVNYEKVSNTSQLLKFIEEKKISFSIVVCDESHRLRNKSTQNYKGADRLLTYADSVVFMSATPIMLKKEDLFNQLHLLAPNIYDNIEVFKNNSSLNIPFVTANSLLNSGVDFSQIKSQLQNTEVEIINTINKIAIPQIIKIDDYFKDYPIYQEIIKDLSSKRTQTSKARLQYNLNEMNTMSTIFSRTRKIDVTKDWTQTIRNPHVLEVSYNDLEKKYYDRAIKDYTISKGGTLYYDEYDRPQGGAMGLVTLKRQLASSLWATISDNDKLDSGIDEFDGNSDSKYQALLTVLKKVFNEGNKKIIIFAIFRKTIKYLNIRLKKAGYNSVMIYGGNKINKFEVLNQFKYDDKIQVLLSSEVGSEGLDMQFCSCMVNYDLPWNPMVIEQRIGRIDRFGQESPKINIYNFVLVDTIVEKIFSRLLERIGIFKSSIGDLDAILGTEFKQGGKRITIKEALGSLEKDFYSDKLTQQEIEIKRKKIEEAIEYEKVNLEKIGSSLTDSLTNDFYFQEEIKKIDKNNAYVTSHELYQFIIQLIKDYLTTCKLETTEDPTIFKLHIPKSDPKAVKRLLDNYQPSGNDNRNLIMSYIREIEDKNELLLTFDQEKAFMNKSLSYVNIYHPIILSGIKMYEQKNLLRQQKTFFFEIDSKYMPDGISKGEYMMAIYIIKVSKLVFGKKVETSTIYPILYNLDNKEIIKEHTLAELFMGIAQVHGNYAPITEDKKLDSSFIDSLRIEFLNEIDNYQINYIKEQNLHIENNRRMRYQQTLQYYDIRIANLKKSIENHEIQYQTALLCNDEELAKYSEGALRLIRYNLHSIEQKKEDDLENIKKDVDLKVYNEIRSLNYVQIV